MKLISHKAYLHAFSKIEPSIPKVFGQFDQLRRREFVSRLGSRVPTLLAIADEMIEYLYFLLRRVKTRLAPSGHTRHLGQCPLIGVKRTQLKDGVMSAHDPERSLQLRRSTGILAFANVNCLAHRAKGLLHVRRFSASDHRCRGAPGHIAWRWTARQRIPPDHKRGPTVRDGATFANRGSAPPAALPVACGF
jgi:hypothetical protein